MPFQDSLRWALTLPYNVALSRGQTHRQLRTHRPARRARIDFRDTDNPSRSNACYSTATASVSSSGACATTRNQPKLLLFSRLCDDACDYSESPDTMARGLIRTDQETALRPAHSPGHAQQTTRHPTAPWSLFLQLEQLCRIAPAELYLASPIEMPGIRVCEPFGADAGGVGEVLGLSHDHFVESSEIIPPPS